MCYNACDPLSNPIEAIVGAMNDNNNKKKELVLTDQTYTKMFDLCIST